MSRRALVVTFAMLAACGGEAPIEPTTAELRVEPRPTEIATPAAEPPPTTVVAAAVAEAAIDAGAPAAVPVDAGTLPAVVPGEPVVLASTLTVRPGRIPTIVLASAEATRDLHDMIADLVGDARCEVLLAVPTLVSVRCARTADPRNYHPRMLQFVIDELGAHPIDLLDLFRDATEESELEAPEEPVPDEDHVWFADALALTERGVETVVLTNDDYFGYASRSDYLYRTVGYREVAPRVRSDRALGVLLHARGLEVWPEVAAPGTSAREVRLRSTLPVRPGTVPTVVLADAAHTAALHALMARYARGREQCRVTMALASLVAMRCYVRESGREGVQSLVDENTYFDIDADGVTHHVEPSELFHVGMADRGVLGPWGAQHWGMPPSLTTYRALASSVRAEGALGRALVAAGLALEPVGFQPHVAVGVRVHGTLAVVAARASSDDDVPARVSVASTDDAWIVFDGSRDPEAVMADTLPFTTVTIEPACASRAVALHESVDPSSPVVAQLAADTEVLVARGSVGSQRSNLGAGNVAYVTHEDDHGWVSADGLLPSYCVVTARDPSDE